MMCKARMRAVFTMLMIEVAVGLVAGCSTGQPRLTLHPATSKISYAQNFTQAYCAKTQDGSYTCVLVSDETPTPGPQKASATEGPLKPSSHTPLRQVVHISVLWRPLSGTRDAAVSNATIDWYVLNNTADGNDDLLVYQGSGYVTLKPDDDTTIVNIQTAELRPAMVHGTLSDPIGDATLTGKFEAINDNQKTKDIVNAARQRTAAIASSR